MGKLAAVGLPRIRIVWWWVTGRGTDFPSTLDEAGVILVGGFDGAVLSLLLGEDVPESGAVAEDGPVAEGGGVAEGGSVAEGGAARPAICRSQDPTATPLDAMHRALDQEVLRLINYDG